MKISPPKSINAFARACLDNLKNSGVGKFIVLGGAFALAHYHDYRPTKDVDAWWTDDAREEDKEAVIEILRESLKQFGEVVIRRFGDVTSVDLRQDMKVVFNFEIATRSALLDSPQESSWSPVRLDTLNDLVAAKMTALIERGAPRDFQDIYELCNQKIVNIDTCWNLLKKREVKRGRTPVDFRLACEALFLHLSRIERVRPLESIENLEQRRRAAMLRGWFKNEFCKGKLSVD